MKIVKIKKVGKGILLTAFLCSTAQASEMEEIIVQARAVDESVRDIPVSVTAFSEEYLEKYKKAADYSGYKESVFIKHINLENSSTLSEKLFQFPGFYLRKITMRDYPSNVATHLIGYLGEVNLKKTKEDPYYTKGDLTGVSGVEAAYEKQLRGTKGMAIKLVDVHNRDQGKFQEGKFDTLPIVGSTLISTIDIQLQEYGE